MNWMMNDNTIIFNAEFDKVLDIELAIISGYEKLLFA